MNYAKKGGGVRTVLQNSYETHTQNSKEGDQYDRGANSKSQRHITAASNA